MTRVIQMRLDRVELPVSFSEDEALSRPIAPPEVADELNDMLTDETGVPLSVDDSIDTYLRKNRSDANTEGRTPRHWLARYNQYPRILDADRQFQREYSLTTATITRRINPLDENDNLLTPWEMDQRLHVDGVHDALWNAFDYHLDAFEWEWCAVTSTGEVSGVPEEYIHLWINDPENEITVDHLEQVLDRHIEYSPRVDEARHPYDDDGTCGAIQFAHDPDIADQSPVEYERVIRHGETVSEAVENARHPTQSAYLIATNLPDLVVWDYYSDEDDNPPATLLEGGTAAWATQHQWFRTSRGLPHL